MTLKYAIIEGRSSIYRVTDYDTAINGGVY